MGANYNGLDWFGTVFGVNLLVILEAKTMQGIITPEKSQGETKGKWQIDNRAGFAQGNMAYSYTRVELGRSRCHLRETIDEQINLDTRLSCIEV
ncbi:hypothetical protein V6N11_068286 [Hibiscus sabdariffa]|uniref:Uncharacterized protein n=1 Tax=Hibiscus sabdariffa TaxID=183260 RepID=A0ABR2A0W1_9ROSI